jgi:hypothetical protein
VKKLFLKAIQLAYLLIIYHFSFSCAASEETLIEFSKNKQWLKLLNYKSVNSSQSYITSPDFFLTKAIDKSSINELKATVSAFYLPIAEHGTADEHAQCVFPARLYLIQQHLNLNSFGKLPVIECPKYQLWRKQIKHNSVSIVFASGYMSNPASMYGHLLLKFGDVEKRNQLLDTSLNYGAIVPDEENPLIYVLRGIFGGYDASFSDQQFFKHKHNYANVELRDMWEYKLALSSEDIDFIIKHLWEVLPTKFDYYFMDENCAFHFARLIELVLEQPIISQDSLWVLPNSVATGLTKVMYKEKPLLKEVKFVPSRETILHNYFEQLTVAQRGIASSIIFHDFSFLIEEYERLSNDEKKIIVEALFQYINVVEKKNKPSNKVNKSKRKLINERLKLPAGKAIHYTNLKKDNAPHLAREPSKFSLGILSVDQKKTYGTSGFRMTYFDDLSSSLGRSDYSNLEMFDIELITDESQTKVLKLDVVDIKSLYLPSIPWRDEVASAWTVRGGYEQYSKTCIDCGIYFVEGSIGKSIRLGSEALGYALIGGKAFAGRDNDIAVYAKVGYLVSITNNIKAKVELNKMESIDFSKGYNTSLKVAVSYEFANHWDVRFGLQKKDTTTASIKLNYYWGF